MVNAPDRTAASFKKDMGTDKKWLLGEKYFTPEELSSFVVRSIVDDAEHYLGEPVEEAALSSYFNTKVEQLFLIFDFGGGTLDISIVDCFDTMVEIVSVAGDNRLGGDTFHELMADNFLKEHQLKRANVSDKEYAVLLHQAESCKRRLTTDASAGMSAMIGGVAYTSEYTNDRLIEESGVILAKIKKVLSQALRDG